MSVTDKFLVFPLVVIFHIESWWGFIHRLMMIMCYQLGIAMISKTVHLSFFFFLLPINFSQYSAYSIQHKMNCFKRHLLFSYFFYGSCLLFISKRKKKENGEKMGK